MEAQRLVQIYQEQLDAGLANLEALRREAGVSPEKPKENGDTSELVDFRRQVQLLRQERDSWLSNRGRHHQTDGVGAIPADPSSLMLGLIEEGDAKRRCVGFVDAFFSGKLRVVMNCSPREDEQSPHIADVARDHEEAASIAGTDVIPSKPDAELEGRNPGVMVSRGAFVSLDQVDLADTLKRRPCVLKNIPRFLKGAFRNALQIAIDAANSSDVSVAQRGWKLFMLLRRMVLRRPARGGLISKKNFAHRFDLFARGEWLQLLEMSEQCDEDSARARRRRRRYGASSFQSPSVGAFGRTLFCKTGIGGYRSGAGFSGDFFGAFRPFEETSVAPESAP